MFKIVCQEMSFADTDKVNFANILAQRKRKESTTNL